MVDVSGMEFQSVQRMALEQAGSSFDQSFAVPEQPIAVAAYKLDLVFAAFLVHRPDVLDGMRAGHLRCELREQVHLGLCPLNHRIAGKYEFLEHQFLCSEDEVGDALIGL